LGAVIVAFNTTGGLNESHLGVLRGVGINGGYTFQHLGMVGVPAVNAAQVRALAANPAVRSVWSNDQLEYFNNQARTVAGVDRVRTDANFTRTNGGLPVSGAGDFSVMVIDSGVDATHNDLKLGSKVVQNVQIVTSTETLTGFTPLVVIENVPNTDQTVGHGTHCAGTIGGTGQMSGSRYAGVAPGAKLVGAGLGAGVFVLNALAGWEWALANQFVYNIRVISNSYGSFAPFDPEDPLNIASRALYERGVVIVFAGANSGPGKGTWNRYAKAPWVIGVAAGHKEGGLANFSSRGTPREERLTNDDPLDDSDAPVITAPGTGREFAFNTGRFTTDIVSTRSNVNVSANGGEADAELAPAYIPFYTQISGTSMATPFVAGVVALMLDADPTLSPDEVRDIITSTATRMPGREDYEVGAGFINAYAAVDKVLNRSRQYGSFLNPAFNAQLTVGGPAPESFSITYNPAATPGEGSVNSKNFTVEPGTDVLDVFARIPAALGYSNTLAVVLFAPDGTSYSSGVATPVLTAPTRKVVVRIPVSGQWRLELRGARGLVAAPGASLPTSGAAQPSNVTGTITKKDISIDNLPADVQNHPARTEIERAIINRRIDSLANGTFRPDADVTREAFALTLSLNTPLRQLLAGAPKFTDAPAALAPVAEALTARGSTLRDYDFAASGLMSAAGTSFNPAGTVSRLDLAVAFVRGLGLDQDAQARRTSNFVITHNSQPLSDNAEIPNELRPYVQIAIEKGFLEVYPAEVRQTGPGQFVALPGPRVEPKTALKRAALAAKINLFAGRFAAGN
ncbi:MAG: S8 family serine peptidase, partial [Pyrinomonadaceae bacterium]